MCGIVGYVGFRAVADFLLEGLHRLEYRGYDSAGIAVLSQQSIEVRKRAGRVSELGLLIEKQPAAGCTGIGHTRWATHGEPTDLNSHPHLGGNGNVAIVHNGVIENHEMLRKQLQQLGYVFHSQTDTEVAAHLIAHHLDEQIRLGGAADEIDTCLRAVEATLERLKGTYGLGVVFRELPDTLIAARCGSPLVIGVGQDEYFLASDSSPLIGYTREVVYMSDHEIAILQPSGLRIEHRHTGNIRPSIQTLDQVNSDIDLGDFEHYMLKEIYEQPQTIENAMRGRLDLEEATAVIGGLNLSAKDLQAVAVNMEKLVKGVDKEAPSSKQLNLRLAELETVLTQALESAQSLGVPGQENIAKLSDEALADIPAELSQDIAQRIRDAAEMGDVTTLKAIAEEIKTHSESCGPLSRQIVQLAGDFDLDGIKKLADALYRLS